MEREHEKWNLAVKGLYGSESLNIFTKDIRFSGCARGDMEKVGTDTACDYS